MKTFHLLLRAAVIFMCFLFYFQPTISAQEQDTVFRKFYGQFGLGPATPGGYNTVLGLTGVFKSNWTAGLTYQNIKYEPKNLPADYKPAYVETMPFMTEERKLYANLNCISFTGGRIFDLGRKFWFTTEAGLSLVFGEELTFTPQQVTGGLFESSSNYGVLRDNKTTVGGVLKADAKWAFATFMGLGAGVFTQFNSLQTSAGFQVNLFFGKAWRKKK
ncbi:hypothetical protein [Flavihumibacter petaseus]|uniref:Outer membrane protein beta-barrel domain-containing protein n=1 Tax=Flavihumibacter petaseus NBRC 106054 TaxID=1220578 RepID=A0A0E9MZ01_9BACT|nr:hypothetical protein [Flavihumibacter petaseus]GAO42631.1 hypothetical protein FPE01S_01_16460 [Flavihumibacter petaseus NBRC 106054]